jgi:hypothetical protein
MDKYVANSESTGRETLFLEHYKNWESLVHIDIPNFSFENKWQIL